MRHAQSLRPSTAPALSAINTLTAATLLVLLAAHPAAGQAFTPISGSIYDGSGGPLLANTIYVATGSLTVPAGHTLTIGAGAGVKFGVSQFTVNGTLTVNGTAAAPVRFTSSADDSVGGDTNGNGPSTGNPSDWYGITFAAGAVGTITQASVRLAGAGGFSGIGSSGAALTLSHVTIANCASVGLQLNGVPAAVSVTNCAFNGNGSFAVDGLTVDEVPGFSSNTASGNNTNYMRVTVGALVASQTYTTANILNGALVLVSNIAVPPGVNLTLQAGTVIKFASTATFTVDGTLHVNGTAGSPVVVTGIADDAFGGDTNNNGASSGSPTSWYGLTLHSTAAASTLNNLVVRYSGAGGYAGILLDACNAALNACRIENSYAIGLQLNSTTTAPTVTGCSFTGNGGVAVDGIPFQAVPTFTNNVASANAGGNFMRVTTTTMTSDLSITTTNCLNGALVAATNLTVPAGRTLTLAPGTCIKFATTGVFQVDGTFLCNGNSGNRVVLTAFADDTSYGDTNNNGPSTGFATAWYGVVFTSTSGASIVHSLDVRFTGAGAYPAIDLRASNLLLEGCHIQSSYANGIGFNAGGANETVGATINGCTITGCGGTALADVPIDALPHHLNNTATGNGVNVTRITRGSVASAAIDVMPSNYLGSALLMADNLTVPAATALTFEPGVICKLQGTRLVNIFGTFNGNGLAAAPVVLTSSQDDSYGGDTTGNGASNGNPTDWYGIVFNPGSSGSFLTQTIVRYAGAGAYGGISFNGGSPSLYTCTVREGYAAGLNFTNSASRPQVIECHLITNGGYAIDNVPVDALGGFANNYATGNHTDIIRVIAGTPATDVFIGPQAGIAITFFDNLSVAAGRTVTILPSTIIKFAGTNIVTVDGALNVRGTGYEPVVFTSYGDDSYGGDSNGNGPSTGNPTDWYGVMYHAGAAASSVENLIIHNTGAGAYAGFTNQSPNVSLRAVRIARSYSDGFSMSALSGGATNWVATGCGGAGIRLSGGSFPVAHATVTGCGLGMAAAGWSGTVYNSIIWGNTTNLSSVPQPQFLNSDGAYAGVNGNINADPQFLNTTTGDLHLPPTSPCIAAGNPGVATVVAKDFDEQSRLIDSNLGGTALPEMGAFERPVWTMDVNGVPRLGATVTFTVQGPPGSSIYVLGGLDGAFPVGNFGMALAGLSPLIIVTLPVGATLPITIPQDVSLLGLSAGIQTLTIFGANPALGSTTTLYRATVRP